MYLVARTLVPSLLLAAATAVLPLSAALASHDRDHCKADVEAEATVAGTGHHAMRRAKCKAIRAWKHEVAAEHGWGYAKWSRAQEKDVRCDSDDGKTECEVEANPCH